ncbi:hypothetical protein E4T56_gene4993 [Termitomyces sp. T112]|nr:hypothetical protein E4T56_gene4993 [Termitomyces sp. T112]KAH0585410.1 hypothetical protein H2248_008651 [Termitomyces sp. 'cryptogamus']
MKSFVALATLLSLAQSIVALTVNTPSNVVSCQPTLLTWSDGQAPFFLSIIPGGQVSAPALKTFPTQNGNSITWIVDLPPNTGITIALKDSTGVQAFSDIVTITGTDTSCDNSNSTSSDFSAGPAATNSAGSTGTSTPAAAGATTSGSAAPSAANSHAVSASQTTPAASASKTSASTASSTQSNAASKSDIGVLGMAGVMALVGLVVA